ncbi:speckle-type POZ protein-like [Calliphora vicina]|uniref:speckle-type POZ protein-like n=1 Tax=Calliphora vicina TaxID=7373 RepID=UPI00325ABA87
MSTSNIMDWCDTEIKITPFSFKWTIKGFNPYSRHNLKSGEFVGNDAYDTEGRKAVSIKKNIDGYEYPPHGDNLIRRDVIFAKSCKLYPKNVLTILCEIHVKSRVVTTMKSQCLSDKMAQETKSTLRDDLHNLIQKKKFCDVIIKTKDDKEIQAHKIVLAARSEVFAAMFEHKMKENEDNCVNIEDFDSDVCEEMLRYIYTGKVPKLDEMWDELLAVADKYNLNGLKTICEQKLTSDLSMENAAKKLVLIDRYGFRKLKDQTIQLLNENAKEFIKSAEFEELHRNFPNLLKELYISAVTKK